MNLPISYLVNNKMVKWRAPHVRFFSIDRHPGSLEGENGTVMNNACLTLPSICEKNKIVGLLRNDPNQPEYESSVSCEHMVWRHRQHLKSLYQCSNSTTVTKHNSYYLSHEATKLPICHLYWFYRNNMTRPCYTGYERSEI